MENNMKELNLEELEKIGGGEWSVRTITPEERAEYEAIGREYWESRYDEARWEAARQALREFTARMDAKYGPKTHF